MFTFKRIIFVLLLLFFLSSFSQNVFKYQQNLTFYNNYKAEYEKQKKQNNQLKTLLVKTSDTYEMEKTIRNKLNMLQNGETVIVVPPITPTPFVPTPTPQAVYQQWVHIFFKN
jgi:cell division protein FtsB